MTIETEAEKMLVSYLRSIYDKPSMGSVVEMVVRAMEMVQCMKGLPTGAQKKAVVMRSLQQFIDDTDMMGVMEPVVLNIIPVMIDNLVAADRHKLKIHPAAVGCFSYIKKKINGKINRSGK